MRLLAKAALCLALVSGELTDIQIELLDGLWTRSYSTYSDELISHFILPRVSTTMESQVDDYYKLFLSRLQKVSDTEVLPLMSQLLHSFLVEASGNLQYEKLVADVYDLCEMKPFSSLWEAINNIQRLYKYLPNCKVDNNIAQIINHNKFEREFNPSFKSSERIIRKILIRRLHNLHVKSSTFYTKTLDPAVSYHECQQYLQTTSIFQKIPMSKLNPQTSTQLRLSEKIIGLHQSICSLFLNTLDKKKYEREEAEHRDIHRLYTNKLQYRLASVKRSHDLITFLLQRYSTTSELEEWIKDNLSLLSSDIYVHKNIDKAIVKYATLIEGFCRTMYASYFVLAFSSAVSDEDLSKVKDKMINDFESFRLFKVLSSSLFTDHYFLGAINAMNHIACSVQELLYKKGPQSNGQYITLLSKNGIDVDEHFVFDPEGCYEKVDEKNFETAMRKASKSIKASLENTNGFVNYIMNNIDNIAKYNNDNLDVFEGSFELLRDSLQYQEKETKFLLDGYYSIDAAMMMDMDIVESIRGINKYSSLLQKNLEVPKNVNLDEIVNYYREIPRDHTIYEMENYDLNSMLILYSEILRERVLKNIIDTLDQFSPYKTLFINSLNENIFPLISKNWYDPTNTNVVSIYTIRTFKWKSDEDIKKSSLWNFTAPFYFNSKITDSDTEAINDASERLASTETNSEGTGRTFPPSLMTFPNNNSPASANNQDQPSENMPDTTNIQPVLPRQIILEPINNQQASQTLLETDMHQDSPTQTMVEAINNQEASLSEDIPNASINHQVQPPSILHPESDNNQIYVSQDLAFNTPPRGTNPFPLSGVEIPNHLSPRVISKTQSVPVTQQPSTPLSIITGSSTVSPPHSNFNPSSSLAYNTGKQGFFPGNQNALPFLRTTDFSQYTSRSKVLRTSTKTDSKLDQSKLSNASKHPVADVPRDNKKSALKILQNKTDTLPAQLPSNNEQVSFLGFLKKSQMSEVRDDSPNDLWDSKLSELQNSPLSPDQAFSKILEPLSSDLFIFSEENNTQHKSSNTSLSSADKKAAKVKPSSSNKKQSEETNTSKNKIKLPKANKSRIPFTMVTRNTNYQRSGTLVDEKSSDVERKERNNKDDDGDFYPASRRGKKTSKKNNNSKQQPLPNFNRIKSLEDDSDFDHKTLEEISVGKRHLNNNRISQVILKKSPHVRPGDESDEETLYNFSINIDKLRSEEINGHVIEEELFVSSPNSDAFGIKEEQRVGYFFKY